VTAKVGEGSLSSALEERIDPGARSRLEVRESGRVLYVEAELPGVFRTVFTSRLGGVSQGPFSTLNLDARSDDDPRAVDLNRTLALGILMESGVTSPAAAGAASGYRFVSPLQAHGVRVVGTAEYASDHAGTPCDGLTVNPMLDRGLAALLVFADCVPVVLAGEVDMAVVHGGWRGILGGVVQQAGRAMTGPPGTAVIGPSIGPCCFTVGEEVARAFGARFGPEAVAGPEVFTRPEVDAGPGAAGAYRVDLWAAATKALAEVGVKEGQVVNPRLCTACNADFFYSYRREGPVTGRQGGIAWAVEA
jgi:copper oxidase (laccase) domain-containing protein